MSVAEPLRAKVLALAVALESAGFRYATVGALARNVWGRPRATTDADFAIAVDREHLDDLRAVIASVGLSTRREIRGDGDAVPYVILLGDPDNPAVKLDLLVASTPFEHSVIERRIRAEIEGMALWAATAEDLLVYKIVAGRWKDWGDVDEVVKTALLTGRAIDWDYVRRFADDFGVADRVDDVRRRLDG